MIFLRPFANGAAALQVDERELRRNAELNGGHSFHRFNGAAAADEMLGEELEDRRFISPAAPRGGRLGLRCML